MGTKHFFEISDFLKNILPKVAWTETYVFQNNDVVFVYGTLKDGEPNHHWLTDENNGKSTFVGKGETETKYPLIVATKYNIPFLLDAPGKGKNVMGEIYEIDEKMLGNLDVLEEHPDFYVRRLEKILSADRIVVECWAYFLPKFKPEFAEGKTLTSYSNGSPHCGPYLESNNEATLDDLDD